jgi:hypothetical protein
MKTKLVIAFVMAAGLAACGGKAKKSTTPENKGSEMNANGSATGGATYGGQTTPAPASDTPTTGGGADPCAGGM